jgi:hypothetical protein
MEGSIENIDTPFQYGVAEYSHISFYRCRVQMYGGAANMDSNETWRRTVKTAGRGVTLGVEKFRR